MKEKHVARVSIPTELQPFCRVSDRKKVGVRLVYDWKKVASRKRLFTFLLARRQQKPFDVNEFHSQSDALGCSAPTASESAIQILSSCTDSDFFPTPTIKMSIIRPVFRAAAGLPGWLNTHKVKSWMVLCFICYRCPERPGLNAAAMVDVASLLVKRILLYGTPAVIYQHLPVAWILSSITLPVRKGIGAWTAEWTPLATHTSSPCSTFMITASMSLKLHSYTIIIVTPITSFQI